jgi:hypothetical protein
LCANSVPSGDFIISAIIGFVRSTCNKQLEIATY